MSSIPAALSHGSDFQTVESSLSFSRSLHLVLAGPRDSQAGLSFSSSSSEKCFCRNARSRLPPLPPIMLIPQPLRLPSAKAMVSHTGFIKFFPGILELANSNYTVHPLATILRNTKALWFRCTCLPSALASISQGSNWNSNEACRMNARTQCSFAA